MEWKNRERSTNVDDRRAGGGSNTTPSNNPAPKRNTGLKAAGGLGFAGIIIAVIVMFLGGDPESVTENTPATGQPKTDISPRPKGRSAKEEEQAEFVKVVLKDTENAWHQIFEEQLEREYVEPTLVLFTNKVKSGCGKETKETGPFYCSYDESLYIDLSFYDELKREYDAPGDFAMAYVIAHEVGHHVQHLLGKMEWVDEKSENLSEAEANKLSVRLELQADFYAGVWAHYAEDQLGVVENGDIDEALNAAAALGDDELMREAGEEVRPESFDHGTSAQRKRWYLKGYETGDLKQGDTFKAKKL